MRCTSASVSALQTGVDYTPTVLYQDPNLSHKEACSQLADHLHLKLDGIICYQDYTAIGLIMELLTRGVCTATWPLSASDHLPIGNLFTIGVTTYAYPSQGIAEQAVRLMKERLREPDRPPIHVVVPGQLIVRESTSGASN